MSRTPTQNNLNIEFTTKSNGKKYNFLASFVPVDETTGKISNAISLNNSNIQSFTWVNEINNILLTGELEYADATGEIGKYFGSYLSYIHISLSIDTSEDFKKSNIIKKNFDHTFMINNFEIKGRTGSFVIYKFYLVSSYWFNYTANINYSNYDQTDRTQCDISLIMRDILKSVFTTNDITVDEESFAKNSTSIQLSYCTTCQTKCMDAIRYLQNRMFYDNRSDIDSETKSTETIFTKGLNFLVLDEFDKKIKMLNFYDALEDQNILKTDNVGTIISLAGTKTEEYVQLSEQNLRSVVKKSNCQSLKSLFNTNFFRYDSTQNAILPFIDLNSSKLNEIGITNNLTDIKDNDSVPIVNIDNILNSFAKNNLNFGRFGSVDNNNFSIYDDLIENLTNRSCLILETSGEISHQPGQTFCIMDDIEAAKKQKDLERSNYKNKNRMLTGVFYIFKVRHTFIPADKDGSGFTERLFVGRTYNAKLQEEVKQ